MAIKLEISADLRQAIQSLQKFSNEIDKAGGVTESTARGIAESLNKATSEFSKLNTVRVKNPLAGIGSETKTSVDEIAKSFSKISDLDFTAQFEQARLKLSDTVDQMVAEALGLNEAFGSIKGDQLKSLNSAFIDAEKPVEQLKQEIFTLRDAIGETTNPIVLERFGSQLSKLQAQLSQQISPKISFSSVQINTPFVAPKIDTSELKNLSVVFGSSIQNIEQLNAEIFKIKAALDEALASGSNDVENLQRKFIDLNTTISTLQTQAFSTAFIDDATKSVQQLENEISVLKVKIDKELTDPTQIQTFAERIEKLQIQLANVKFGGVELDTSKLTVLQSAFVDAVKPVQQLEAEIRALQEAIDTGTNPAQLQVFNAQLLKLQTQLNSTRISGFEGALKRVSAGLTSTGVASTKTTEGLKKLAPTSNASTLAMTNLGRVLQDAPFGFLGIANNLNPLLESFQRLQQQAGGVGGAIRSLGSSLLGAGGLGLALSAIQFFALGGGEALGKFARVLREFFGAAKPLVDVGSLIANTFKKAAEAAGPEIARLEVYKTKLNDLNIPASERIKLAKEYNEIADKQNQIDSAQINNLDQINSKIARQNELILQRSISTAAIGELGTFADEFVAKTLETRQAIANTPIFQSKSVQDEKDINKRFELAEKLFTEKAKAFSKKRDELLGQVQDQKSVLGVSIGTKTRFGIEQEQDKLNEEIERTLGKQGLLIVDAISARKTAADKLKSANDALSSLITIDGLVTKQKTTTDKTKFEFLFDFLPFDPEGKLKGEQKKQLLDAIDKFSKEFQGILKDVDFGRQAKSQQEKILLALQFNAKLKVGKVELDLTRIKEETDKALKPEDLIPDGGDFIKELQILDEAQKTAVDQFIKGLQNESERIKNLKVFGDIDTILNKDQIIDNFKTKFAQIGEQIPKFIEVLDEFGIKRTVSIDAEFNTTKLQKGLEDALKRIKELNENLSTELNNSFTSFATDAFTGVGESIGQSLASGGDALQKAAQSFIGVFSGFLSEIGKILIKYGILKTGIEEAIQNFAVPGATLIALGVAAIALSAAMKASLGNVRGFNKGGIVPGQGNTDSVPALLTPGELVIPKDQVAKVQKLLKESVSFKLPSNLFGTLGLSDSFNKLKQLSNFSFNIPQLSIPRNTDVRSPLGKVSFALGGAAAQNVNVRVDGFLRGNDMALQAARVNKSQKSNYGRGSFGN